jgi:NDP-sugar pyrophosphorylase family protein
MEMIVLAAGQGTRLRELTGGRPKHLLEAGGMTILDRHLAFAESAGLAPVIVTRAELAEDFRGRGAEVIVEEAPWEMITSLHFVRSHVREPFVWVGGDMLFTDFAPLCQLIAAYRDGGYAAAFPYCRSRRFKGKLSLDPEPQVRVTRQGDFPFSIPNFAVQSLRMFDYLPGDFSDPAGNYLQRALDQGEPVLFQEYGAPVFEIDTAADIAEVDRFYDLARAS